MAEGPTLDALTRSNRPGDLKRELKGLINLPLGLGCWGSIGARLKTMDEARARCNQRTDTSATRPGHMTRKSRNITNLCIQQTLRTPFKLDTVISEHIYLDIDKYILTILSTYYPVPFMGECWSCKRTVDVCLLDYISARAHYLHFLVH